MNQSDTDRRLAVARRAAAQAGDYLLNAFWDPQVITPKGAYDLHLGADTEASQIITAVLGQEFPEEFLLEEDGPPDPLTSEWVWIVDPLDGTVNYRHHLPWYCVSIACYHRTEVSDHPLWRHGRPVASVVLAPALGQEFWALAGQGAWVGDRRLSVSTEGLGSGILSVSRGSKAADQVWVKGFLAEVGAEARKTRNQGAAALDLAYVAQGSLAAHVQRSIQSWDIAAGAHLVLEAGGRFDSQEDPTGGQHVVAGGPAAFDRLLEVCLCGSS